MRVLLRNDATRITAATIVALPGHGTGGRVSETLAGEPYPAEALVADVADRVVADVIASALRERRAPGLTARGLFADLWRTARILAPYALRSSVLQRLTPGGWVVDLSAAVPRGGRYEYTSRDSAVAWELIEADYPECAGGVFDEGLAATIRRVRQWRYRAARSHRDAEEAHAILTGRPLPAWVDGLDQALRTDRSYPTPRR